MESLVGQHREHVEPGFDDGGLHRVLEPPTTKIIMPGVDEYVDDDDDDVGETFGRRRLNVDPDVEMEDDEAGGHEDRLPSQGSWFSGAKNSLKLSVGCVDDDEDEEVDPVSEKEILREQLRNWHAPPKQEDFDVDVEYALSADKVRAIIQGEDLFAPAENRALNEVFSQKKGPKVLSGYLFGDVIGNGSYAKVKEVMDQCTLTRRAIKIMKFAKLRRIPNGLENVRREIEIMRKIDHVHVIRLLEVFESTEKGKLYMVMDFCIGSVQQQLDSEPQKRLSVGETHRIFRQLMRGLDYLHSMRIVHKDIKPGNMLLTIDFVLKICDFGVAEQLPLFQADGMCKNVQGTPKFQAPELVSGNETHFDAFKADVWSSGISLYNIVSGEYPFEGQVIMTLFDNIATLPLEMPKSVDLAEDVQSLLTMMLDKNPATRWGTHEVLTSDWLLRNFPEDDGLGSIAERIRTGSRPLTVISALDEIFSFGGNCLDDGLEEPEPMTVEVVDVSEVVQLPPTSPSDAPGRREEEPLQVPVGSPPSPPPPRARKRPKRVKNIFSCFLPSRSP